MHSRLFFVLGTLAATATAFGHGVQVQATYNTTTHKIETRKVVATTLPPGSLKEPVPAGYELSNTLSALKRIYVAPVDFLANSGGSGDGYYARFNDDLRQDVGHEGELAYPTGAGLTWRYEDQLAGAGWSYNGSVTAPNLQGKHFGYAFTTGLLNWNGVATVDAGTEQLQFFRGDGLAAITTSIVTADASFASMNLSNVTSKSSNPHTTLGLRLLGGPSGSSPTTASDEGIYIVGLKLTTDATDPTFVGALESEPFYFVLANGASMASAIDAAGDFAALQGIDSNQIQVIPEPASVMVLAVAGLAALRRRCR